MFPIKENIGTGARKHISRDKKSLKYRVLEYTNVAEESVW